MGSLLQRRKRHATGTEPTSLEQIGSVNGGVVECLSERGELRQVSFRVPETGYGARCRRAEAEPVIRS